jgi:hypothetical protein
MQSIKLHEVSSEDKWLHFGTPNDIYRSSYFPAYKHHELE